MDEKKSLTGDINSEEPTFDLGTPVSLQFKAMTKDDWREQFLEDHFQCCLCGQALNFSHNTNFSTLEVDEEVHCLSCKIRTRKHQHILQ